MIVKIEFDICYSDTDNVNKYFADISFDQTYYDEDLVSIRPLFVASVAYRQPLYAYEVEATLRKV